VPGSAPARAPAGPARQEAGPGPGPSRAAADVLPQGLGAVHDLDHVARQVAALQRTAGNAALASTMQRLPGQPQAPGASRGRTRSRRPQRPSLGPDEDVLNFATYFELATAPTALGSGRFDSGVAFSTPTLARAWESVTWIVGVLGNRRRGSEIREAGRAWDDTRETVTRVLARLRAMGVDPSDAQAGFERLERRLHRLEAAELTRVGEEAATLSSPDAGLVADQDRQLGQLFHVLGGVIKEGEGLLQWNDRHMYRLISSTYGAALTDAQVRFANVGRTALGWAALWEEGGTLQERMVAARRRGLLDASATAADFVSRATAVGSETLSVAVRSFETTAAAQTAAWARALRANGIPMTVAEAQHAQWNGRLQAFKGLRLGAVGLAGSLQLVSSTLNLVRAIRDQDLRAGVAAGHGVVQGGITLGGAVLSAGAAATTMLSGSVTVLWVTIETIFDIAQLSAWGRRQRALEEIARPLRGAASLIPWGRRMAGVADALLENDSSDPAHRAALEEQLIARGTEPYNIVLRGLHGVQTLVDRRPELGRVMGPEARAALAQLASLRYRDSSDPVSPWDIQMLSELARPIFSGLQRVSVWAMARYGNESETEAARARVRELEAGGAAAAP
jgi:hypothetical protein